MRESTQKLLDQIDEAHDWDDGQPYGGHGDVNVHGTDVCRVCSLRRHWTSYYRKPNEYRFSDGETDQDLSLRQAAARQCP